MLGEFRNSMNEIYRANKKSQNKQSVKKFRTQMSKIISRKRKSKVTDNYLKKFIT